MSCKNHRGFSLVAVMIACLIGGIVALAMATLMVQSHKSQNNVKFRQDADNLTEEIRSALSSPVACMNSFGHLIVKDGVSYPITQLKDNSSKVQYKIGGVYGDKSSDLMSMTLHNYDKTAQTLNLDLVFKSDKQSIGSQNVSRKIRISIEKDTSNKIISCVALAKMSDGIWQRVPTNNEDVFFKGTLNGGKVGIGTATPVAPLDVAGNVYLHPPGMTSPDYPGKKWNVLFRTADGHGDQRLMISYENLYDTPDLVFRDVSPQAHGKDVWWMALSSKGGTSNAQADTITFFGGTKATGKEKFIVYNGNVGIGIANPTAKLDVAGSIRANKVSQNSDRRLKKNIKPLAGAYEKIQTINGVSFDWKDAKRGSGRQIGVIAQNVQKIYPEVVTTGKDGLLSVDYAHLIAPLIESFKTMATKIAAVTSRQSKQDKELAQLKKENQQLKVRLDHLESKLKTKER